ncbi:hypothetical protein BpHYR1_014478 [Brachionus plicatilis]|uniref:Uncharacterized protein n=1 Tax=Brachionus plicatilis TaxID=10195 RepID=A0A3M7RAN1_BRAPC|nr:hypothetical protein BpHYR1_014478 [Brachionus plicatilis]
MSVSLLSLSLWALRLNETRAELLVVVPTCFLLGKTEDIIMDSLSLLCAFWLTHVLEVRLVVVASDKLAELLVDVGVMEPLLCSGGIRYELLEGARLSAETKLVGVTGVSGALMLGLGERLEIEKSGDLCLCRLGLSDLADRPFGAELLPDREFTDTVELDLPRPRAASFIFLKLPARTKMKESGKSKVVAVEGERADLLVDQRWIGVFVLDIFALAQQRQIGVQTGRQIEQIEHKHAHEYCAKDENSSQLYHVLCLKSELDDHESFQRHGDHQPNRDQGERVVHVEKYATVVFRCYFAGVFVVLFLVDLVSTHIVVCVQVVSDYFFNELWHHKTQKNVYCVSH